MKHRTLVESDGKTVFIIAGNDARRDGKWIRPTVSMLLVLALFSFVLWQVVAELKMGIILWFLLFRFGGYPALRRMIGELVLEEVEVRTDKIISQRSYGFIRGKKRELSFEEGGLATGGDAVNKTGTQMRISWFTEDAARQTPRLLYRHFFPMTAGDYEKAKEYVQELYDIEEEDNSFELLFSAN